MVVEHKKIWEKKGIKHSSIFTIGEEKKKYYFTARNIYFICSKICFVALLRHSG